MRFINPLIGINRSKIGTFNDELEDLYNHMMDNFKEEQLQNLNKATEEFNKIKSGASSRSVDKKMADTYVKYSNKANDLVKKYRDDILIPKLYGEDNYKLINYRLESKNGLYNVGREYDEMLAHLLIDTNRHLRNKMLLVKPISGKRSVNPYARAPPLKALPSGVSRSEIPIALVESMLVDTKRMDSSDGGIVRLIRKIKTKKVKRKGRKGRTRRKGRKRRKGPRGGYKKEKKRKSRK